MGVHDGHRARIRERLSQGIVMEHEILEILLFNAVPRLNTNELAHRLLATFGSIPGVLSATMEQLQEVEGMGSSLAAYIHCCGLCFERCYVAKMTPKARQRVYETDSFIQYVVETYGQVDREILDLYALDENGNIIICKRFTQDSLFNVSVSPEQIGKFLTDNKACGLVMVHNHPFGDAEPSASDDFMTMKCQLICSLQNVLLCDHVIYSPEGAYSYYRKGRLQEISAQYSVNSVLAAAFKVKGQK